MSACKIFDISECDTSCDLSHQSLLNAYSIFFSGEAKELHVVCATNHDTVANTLCINTLHHRSIDRPSVSTLRIISLRALRLVVVVTEYTSPLLHSLLIVLRTQGTVRTAMVDLHLWAAAIVAGIHVEDDIGPGFRSCNGLAIRTGAVPGIDATRVRHEAASIDARVDDASFEDIRVCCGQNIRHHRATARACDENLLRICLIFLQGPFHHVCDSVAITTTFVRQCLLAANVPACSGMRRTGVNDNEAILLCERLVGAAVEVRLCSSGAVVNSYNDTRGCGELLWHIDVEARLGWGVSKRCDLGQAARCRCALS
jgi:hypothetical protein